MEKERNREKPVEKKKLFIGIDPGFDSYKVIANGKSFKFPASVLETDERNFSEYIVRDDFMLLKTEKGITYRIGQYAREKMHIDKDIDLEKNFFGFERFGTPEFKVGIETAIALAIENAGLYDEHKDLDIYLIIAVPHVVKAMANDSDVLGLFLEPFNFSLILGKNEEKKYNFLIDQSRIKTVSQTIALMLGEVSSNEGRINESNADIITNGPTLMLDGGYYTVGMVQVSAGGSIDEKKAFSNTDYAMRNVNMKVCKEIEDRRPDIRHTSIEHLIEKQNGILKYMSKEGKAGTINLNQIRDEKIKETCSEFIDFLNQTYNYLQDFNYILVSGGTGTLFYPYILEYYTGSGLFDRDHVILAKARYKDDSYSDEFAIVAGAYKGLLGKFSQN